MATVIVPRWGEVLRLHLPSGPARDGEIFVLSADRDANGHYAFDAPIPMSNCSRAIEAAGSLSTLKTGVVVISWLSGEPTILARYGELPPGFAD